MQTTLETLGEGLVLHRIADDATLAEVRARIKAMARDDSPHVRFPGPNPVSLDSSRFDTLKKPYYVCEKSDGTRYALVCCHLANTRNVVALVDRAMAAYLLPLAHVPRAMFQGSVLDGELVFNKLTKAWDFMVFDAVCISGVPVLDDSFKHRMEGVHRVLRVYKPSTTDAVHLKPKAFYRSFDDFESVLPRLQEQYDIDGVILTPAVPGVVYGRHMDMFKVKFSNRHTVDFLVGADGVTLCVFDAGSHAAVAALAKPRVPGSIVECAFVDRQWTVVTVRTDKTTANDMFTYKKTLLNIRENLSVADVKRHLSV